MSIRDKSRNLGHRLKKVVKAVPARRKKPRSNGPPSWLGVGASADGTRRVYYLKLRFPRRLLLMYLYCRRFTIKHRIWTRVITLSLAALIVFSVVYPIYQSRKEQIDYELATFEPLLDDPVSQYAEKLQYDEEKGGFAFNKGYTAANNMSGDSSAPKITANFGSRVEKNAVTVSDPVNDVGITITPRFSVAEPRKSENRVIYPILGKGAVKVYTMKASGIKEDILLRKPGKDSMQFDYDIKLPAGVELRSEGTAPLRRMVCRVPCSVM